ncbi:MAG: hypothetical protein KF773_11270 [Deltaproteobacteria bacterium]|nr:hypothetical protein [Deltaproteobacteria bacterium]
MMRAIVMTILVGCASAPASSPEPARPTPAAPRPPDPVRAADPVLGDWRPDYAKPFVGPDLDPDVFRAGTSDLDPGGRVCMGVERGPCWLEGLPLADQCRAGHRMSCRAMQVGDGVGLPGEAGRASYWCYREDFDKCDFEAIARECDAGFRWSCLHLKGALHEFHLELVARIYDGPLLALAREGCRQGISADCYELERLGTPDDKLHAREEVCRRNTKGCDSLVDLLLERGEPERALRILERTCQRGEPLACERVALGYQRGVWAEPVAGRGAQLLAWACGRPAWSGYRIDCATGARDAP